MTGITIDGTFNTRVLGIDPQRHLLRSATLDQLSVAGIQELGDVGLALVIDLREPSERGDDAHGFPVALHPIYCAVDGPPLTGSLEEIYETLLLTRGTQLTAAVAQIADADGPVLVHCTAGKDRTGLVVALALLAAGVSENEILTDYALSGLEVAPRRRAIAEGLLAHLDGDDDRDLHTASLRLHLDSPREALQHAFDVLARFSGPEAWLLRHGLDIEQFAALRSRLGGISHES
ncbi:MAG: tyrosine-protein phosphatase [Glaciihabitans sp.]|nr:tyrosine-protein phosphatase [Glaciihabitans sp.]